MKIVLLAVGTAAVAAAAYFGLSAAGMIGAPAKLSEQELTTGLSAYADEINADDGLRFDDFSRLERAVAVEKTITIYGRSLLDFADLNDGYHDSRIAQAKNKLCRDAKLRPLIHSGARFQFWWKSADDESIGDIIRLQGGDEACGDIPFPTS